jgi:hypothetical protein
MQRRIARAIDKGEGLADGDESLSMFGDLPSGHWLCRQA